MPSVREQLLRVAIVLVGEDTHLGGFLRFERKDGNTIHLYDAQGQLVTERSDAHEEYLRTLGDEEVFITIVDDDTPQCWGATVYAELCEGGFQPGYPIYDAGDLGEILEIYGSDEAKKQFVYADM